jgi:hypothetical protein
MSPQNARHGRQSKRTLLKPPPIGANTTPSLLGGGCRVNGFQDSTPDHVHYLVRAVANHPPDGFGASVALIRTPPSSFDTRRRSITARRGTAVERARSLVVCNRCTARRRRQLRGWKAPRCFRGQALSNAILNPRACCGKRERSVEERMRMRGGRAGEGWGCASRRPRCVVGVAGVFLRCKCRESGAEPGSQGKRSLGEGEA